LTVKQIAGVLQVKENTVCSLASRGTLPGFKLGRAWRFDPGKVESLFAGRPQRGADQSEGNRNMIRKEMR
jgi:excisionase family DNA binding protein